MTETSLIHSKGGLKSNINQKAFKDGMKDSIPIGMGYFAVAFTLGIAARNAGLNAFQGFLASLLNNASAGEYAGFLLIAANSSYLELALVTFITNARYLLMSCALSQRLAPDTPLRHRFLMSYDVTDELFGIAIARPGCLNPYYSYGAALIAAPCWAFGTALGVISGNILPLRMVSALSVALYGMFLAVIIPPSRHDKVIGLLVISCFAVSYISTKVPILSNLTDGTRTILLTVVICSVVAILVPRHGEEQENVS